MTENSPKVFEIISKKQLQSKKVEKLISEIKMENYQAGIEHTDEEHKNVTVILIWQI